MWPFLPHPNQHRCEIDAPFASSPWKFWPCEPKVEHPSPCLGSCPPQRCGASVWTCPPRCVGGDWAKNPRLDHVPRAGVCIKTIQNAQRGRGGHGRGHDFCWLIVVELGNVWDHVPPAVWGDMFDGPLASISLERAEFCSLARVAPVIPNCEE